jgi:hypothetical protein
MAEVGYGVGRVRRAEFAGAVGSLTVVVLNGHCQLGEADWGCFPGQSWVEDGVAVALWSGGCWGQSGDLVPGGESGVHLVAVLDCGESVTVGPEVG